MDIASALNELIRSSPEHTFEYAVDLEERCLRVSSTNISERLSTILGSRGGVDLVVDIEDVKKLPHDLVHMCILAEPERCIPGTNLTPDIQLSDGSIIEVATRATFSDRSLSSAISDKLLKYGDFSDRLCVVAVNYNTALSTHDLDDDNKAKLVRHYRTGVSMMKALLTPLGIEKMDPSVFAGMNFPEKPSAGVDIPILNNIYHHPELKTWDQYINSTQHSKKGLRHKSSIVKVPMIQFTDSVTGPTASSSIHIVNQIITALHTLKPQHIEDMRGASVMASKVFKGRKSTRRVFKDQIKLILDSDDRVELALKGVRAKKYKDNPLVKQENDRRSQPIDCQTPTAEIDRIANLPINRIQQPVQPYDERLTPLIDGFQECLENLEHILREVALNMTRRVRSDEFIVRKLLNKPCYVIISTTSYATSHDKPAFFLVIAHGRPLDTNLFGRWNPISNGWHSFGFVSTDRRRTEHLMGLPEQSLSLRIMLEEQLGDLNPKYTWTNLRFTHRILMFILLADNNNLSITLQNLRYYYMELYCSGHPNSSLKILKKLPETIRSLMQLWVLKRLSECHPREKIGGFITEVDEELGLTGASQDTLVPVETPFGFTIDSLDKMLLASYLCMLKNKDEQNQGHDSKAILKKTLKREYEYRDRLAVEGASNPILEHKESKMYRTFEASGNAIRLGADLVKRKICNQMSSLDWGSAAKELLWAKAYKQTINDLFSTKSSSTASADKTPEDLKEYDKRSKVFLRLLTEQKDFSEDLLMNCFPDWIDKVKPTVSLFKKNQIGGVREIYILSFWFRVAIKYVEDISRSICSGHPSEALTKPNAKDDFVSNHFSECKRKIRSSHSTVTFRISSDMTNWANLMMSEFFDCCLKEFLPDSLYNNVKTILEIHKKKRLYLPKALISSFQNTRDPDSYSDVYLNRLRKEFIGFADPLLTTVDKPWISCETNMMQGILHYTSSLYHLCHLEVFKLKAAHLADSLGLGSQISFIVSSDDEGILLTLHHEDPEQLSRLARDYLRGIKSLKCSVDSLFGVRTSWEKTSMTIREIFEFNSVFRVRNTVGSPLIKFICRSVDDNISETLNARVRAMYQQLRSIRENGGSGALCSLISTLQQRHLRRNFGEGVMGWFNSSWFDEIPNFSFYGKLMDHGPIISGVADIDYQNWVVCNQSPEKTAHYHKRGFRVYVDSSDKEHSISFRMFSRRKLIKALKDHGLSPSVELTLNDLRIVMSRTRSLADKYRLNEIRAISPGIAASFSFMARTDNIRLSAYLLTAPLFDGKTYSDLVETDFSEEKAPPLTVLFPNHFEYSILRDTAESHHTFIKARSRRSKKFKYYFPIQDQNEHRKKSVQVLSSVWFSDENLQIGRRHIDRLYDKIQLELPWIRRDPESTLAASPFDNYHSLLSFLDQLSKTTKPWKMLSVTDGGRKSLAEIHEQNSFPGYVTTVEASAPHQKTYDWMVMENRVAAWSSLLGAESDPPLEVVQDLSNCADMIPDEVLDEALSTGRKDARKLARIIKSCRIKPGDPEPILQSYIERMEEGEEVWVLPQSKTDLGYEGLGILLIKHLSTLVELTLRGNTVTMVKSLLSSHQIYSYVKQRGFDMPISDLRHSKEEPFYPNRIIAGYVYGFRLIIEPISDSDISGHSGRVWGCRHTICSQIEFNYGDPFDPVIDAYLNNLGIPNGHMIMFEKSRSPLRRKFADCVKELRTGSTLVRLSERPVPKTDYPEEKLMSRESKEASELLEGMSEMEVIMASILEEGSDDEVELTDLVDEMDYIDYSFDRERDHVFLISGRALYAFASSVGQYVLSGSIPDELRPMCLDRELLELDQIRAHKPTTRLGVSSRFRSFFKRAPSGRRHR